MYWLRGLIFSVTLILSLWGWGLAVSRLLLGRSDQPWPFQAAWGACLVMLLGGLLAAFSAVGPYVNFGILSLGLLAYILLGDLGSLPSRCWRSCREAPEWGVILVYLGLFCLARHLAALYPSPWNQNDDSLAYAAFPKKLLESGTLIEPFSWRRLSGYGGYAYLHSMALTVLSSRSLHILDLGVMNTLAAFAIAYYARSRLKAPPLLAGAAGLLFAVLDLPRINLSPGSILSLLSLALLHAVQVAGDRTEGRGWRPALLVGLVAAGLASVRVTAFGFMAPFFGLVLLGEVIRTGRLREPLGHWLAAGGAALLLLAPWILVLWRSSHTPLWPLFAGDFNPAIPINAHPGMVAEIIFQWGNLHFGFVDDMVLLAAVGFAAGTLPAIGAAYVAAALVAAVLTIHSANLALPEEILRYYAPFTRMGALLALTAAAAWLTAKVPRLGRRAPVVGALGVCAAAAYLHPYPWNVCRPLLLNLCGQPAAVDPRPYTAALAHIPEGAKVLVEVDYPFLLDYRRHRILTIDEIGMASPGRGLVLRGDPEGLLAYLRAQGIGYLMFVRPSKSIGLYSRKQQQDNLSGPSAFYRRIASDYLWLFDTLDVLSKRYPVSYEDDRAVVLPVPPGVPPTGAGGL